MTRLNTDRPGNPGQNGATAVKTASGLNIAAALWLIAAPFLLGYFQLLAALWNDIFVGVIVLGLASERVDHPAFAPGFSWANAVLGVWLILAPFMFGYSATPAALWNDIVVGTIVASLAVWSALATPHRPAMGK